MRTDEDKTFIASRFSPSYCRENFLSLDDIAELVDFFYSLDDSEKVFKNTGPITASLLHNTRATSIMKKLQDKVFDQVGECVIYNTAYFKVDTPHIIHNDDLDSFPLIYKAFTLPLEITCDTDARPEFVTFNQHYLDGPSKFVKGGTSLETFYNSFVTDYKNVINLNDDVPLENPGAYFPHIKRAWLEGLTIEQVFDWRPGNALIFDCPRLHAASDFRLKGIKSKLGLSIFTYTERQ